MELTLQEVFDEVCPSEEEELWPSEVNLEGAEHWGGMDVDGFVKAGGGGTSGKRKGNRSRDASSDPLPKKACKDQVTISTCT